MSKEYLYSEREITAVPRSKRRRQGGMRVVVERVGGTSVSPAGSSTEGHSHENKGALDKLGVTIDGYVTVTDWRESSGGVSQKQTEKSKSGYADRSGIAAEAVHAQDSDYATAAGTADEAAFATEADHATEADTATEAAHAQDADHADESDHSLEADEANHLSEDSADWETIDGKIAAQALLDEQKYLRKDQDDTTPHNLGIGGNLGVSCNMSVLGKATIDETDTGDLVVRGRASSLDFVSGLLSGTGWGITRDQVENALGVLENKYHLEIDNLTVRGQMRIYELIISQLLGENDNRVFTGMMEVDHYDVQNGRVYFDNKDGRLYNPFREGDYIRVQRYNPGGNSNAGQSGSGSSYLLKSYECVIVSAYSGYEGGVRVDWCTIRDLTTGSGGAMSYGESGGGAAELIENGDTFTRWDNETDPERKGVISMMTVGPQTPYMDVHYGMKTDPSRSLKSRMGNLSGLRTDLFGWLDGFGAYLTNLYGVGKFRNAQTGESLTSRIEATREQLKSLYEETIYNIGDDENMISNGFFQRGLTGWSRTDASGTATAQQGAGELIGYGGVPMLVNGMLTGVSRRMEAEISSYDGVKVLKLQNCGLSQSFSLLTPNGTHPEMTNAESDQASDVANTATRNVANRLYLSVRILALTSGTLSVRFVKNGGTSTGKQWAVSAGLSWQLLEAQDAAGNEWDYTGNGRLVVTYTGECLIRFVALTTDPIGNARLQYMTLIEQTSRSIRIEARKRTALGEQVAAINVRCDEISATVTNNKSLTDAAIEQRRQDLLNYIALNDPRVAASASWIQTNQKWVDIVSANWDANGNLLSAGSITVLANGILTQAQTYVGGQLQSYYTKTETSNLVTTTMTNFRNGDFYLLQQRAGAIEQTIGTLATKAELQAAQQQAASDLADAVDELEDVIAANQAAQASVNTAMSDGVIDAEERAMLRALKKSLKTEYDEAVAAYTKVYNNPRLTDTSTPSSAKTNLYDKKGAMDTAYTNVDAKIDQLISTTQLTDGQADQVNTTFTAFDTALKNYRQAIEDAYRAIENKIVSEASAALEAVRSTLANRADALDAAVAAKAAASDVLDLMTWRRESKAGYDQVAALYNTETGTIVGLSEVIQHYNQIAQTVGTLATSAALQALGQQLQADIDDLESDLSGFESSFGTWQSQTNSAIQALAAKFDAQGNLIGYSNTTQTSSMISQSVNDLVNGRVAQLETRATGIEGRVTTAEGDVAQLKVSVGDIDLRVGKVSISHYPAGTSVDYNNVDYEWQKGRCYPSANTSSNYLRSSDYITDCEEEEYIECDNGSVATPMTFAMVYNVPSGYRVTAYLISYRKEGNSWVVDSYATDSDTPGMVMLTPGEGIRRFKVQFYSPASIGNNVSRNIGDLQPEFVTVKLTGSLIRQTIDSLKLMVERCGIDITNKEIAARADKFTLRNLAGEQVAGVNAAGDFEVSGTIKAKNLYRNAAIFFGGKFYESVYYCASDDYEDEGFYRGHYYTEAELMTEYGNSWSQMVGFVACSYDADLVHMVPNTSNVYDVAMYLPDPNDFPNKVVEVRGWSRTTSEVDMKVRCVTGNVLYGGISYNNGFYPVGQTGEVTVKTGVAHSFQSLKIGTYTRGWILLV